MLLYSFVAAIGFLLILEGIGPFLAPKRWRQMMTGVSRLSDRHLHVSGFAAMVLGLIIIILAHNYL